MSDNIKDVDVEINDALTTDETVENIPETDLNAEAGLSEEITEAAATEETAKEDPDNGAIIAEENASEASVDDDDDDEDEDEAEPSKKKGRKNKKPRTREQRRKRRITALIATGAVVLVLAIFFGSIGIANPIGVKALIKQAQSFTKVDYGTSEQLIPEKEADGYWTFTTDKEFKVLQFTDVHIGGGCFSQQKDMWAMNAVAKMVTEEKPDLVVITGDIAYPVPFQAGTFNNLSATKIFANLMESLGVYWTFAFGNHDTEAYSKYTRKDICEYYEQQIDNGNFKYCLFQRGFSSDDNGYGNSIIKVKNTAGIVTQALVTFDSHSYIEGDYFGMAWKYDNIHKEQVDWYAAEMKKLVAANKAIDPNCSDTVKNLAFFHIPLVEYREAWAEIMEKNGDRKDNNIQSTENVKYHYGVRGESDGKKNGQRTYGVFCGLHEDDLFEVGFDNGLQGTFCGHDHYNNFSVSYTKDGKTIRLTYGMSVDYLAYPGIYKEHLQRGCTVITVNADGSLDDDSIVPKNYYTDYGVKHEKG